MGPYESTHSGLPTYFTDVKGKHPKLDRNHPARGEFYYVNDGPQIPGEPDPHYHIRIRQANKRMGIEHRVRPPIPSTEGYPGGYQNADWKKKEGRFWNDIRNRDRQHEANSTPKHKEYDANYEARWDAEKRLRQARNAIRRQNAVAEVREHFRLAGYDRLPTPDPAEDSGDDLNDWGVNGRFETKFKRGRPRMGPLGRGRAAPRPIAPAPQGNPQPRYPVPGVRNPNNESMYIRTTVKPY